MDAPMRDAEPIFTPVDTKSGSVSLEIADALRQAITDGVLTDGQPLRQSELAKNFGVSTIPVREALKQLEAEGLIAFLPHRGAVVTGLSEADILEYSDIRASLESMAAGLAMSSLTRVDLALIEDAYEAFVSGTGGRHGMAQSGRLNWEFHGAIYAAARRPRLYGMIHDLHSRLDRYIRAHLELPGRKSATDAEHFEILRACRERDGDALGRLTRQHILDAASLSLDVIRNRNAS
ncbi:GntR family transcriptional regulator [Gluconobacter kanchanaburiensis NBRC 103587]|nr:GntR family transcriptional regulator [Gluconobacter kanchanaburiensis NBRC 103587]